MSVFGLFRPKWQHPDPFVRADAVGRMTDQSLLAQIVETDPDEKVRQAAFDRLKDQDLLAHIAKSRNPFNTRALDALTDSRLVVTVAREAETPNTRELAVRRINDQLTLKQIASQDPDPTVRSRARTRGVDATGVPGVLKHALARLQVAEQSAAQVAEYCGSLDDVCGALLRDERFRIDGVLASAEASEAAAPAPLRVVELLARKTGPAADNDDHYFQIRVWRPAEDAFHCSLEERKSDPQHDLEAWSRSSGGA